MWATAVNNIVMKYFYGIFVISKYETLFSNIPSPAYAVFKITMMGLFCPPAQKQNALSVMYWFTAPAVKAT